MVPDLAESFEPSDGAKKWVFKVRKGATFHNGKTVTADDVVASVRHHTIEGTKSVIKSLLASVKNVVADGAETVVFELDGAMPTSPTSCRTSRNAGERGRRRLGVGHPHRPLYAREIRARRHRHLQQEPELLQIRQGLVRPCRMPGDHRCDGAHQRAQHRRGPLHGSLRSEDARHSEAEPRSRRSRRRRATATTSMS